MSEPDWIDEPVVLALHLDQLKAFGGLAGVRDRGLLLSALSRARNVWAYSSPKPDVIRLTASYIYGLAKNHPFLDGNKRTSLVVGLTFLRRNGWDLRATQAERAQAILDVASGAMDESALEAWFRGRAFPKIHTP